MPDHRNGAYGIRFKPDTGGNAVSLEVFTKTLAEIVGGLNSLRHALAPILAEKVGWPTADVRDFLTPAVSPVRSGSLVVPVALGAAPPGMMVADGERITSTFWRYSAALLHGTAKQRTGLAEIPAIGAEHFASAARIARVEGRSSLQLARETRAPRRGRDSDTWRSLVDLTRIEDGLHRYAERRNVARRTNATLIGQVERLVWNPPGIVLQLTGDRGTRTLSMSASRRDDVRKLWGDEVIVVAEVEMTPDGEIRGTPKILEIKPAVRIDDLEKNFEQSVGSGRDVWGTKEAEDYLAALRRRDPS